MVDGDLGTGVAEQDRESRFGGGEGWGRGAGCFALCAQAAAKRGYCWSHLRRCRADAGGPACAVEKHIPLNPAFSARVEVADDVHAVLLRGLPERGFYLLLTFYLIT